MSLLEKRRPQNNLIIDIFNPFDQSFPSIFDVFTGFDTLFGATSMDDFHTEMIENADNFVLRAELPGMGLDDIDITFNNDVLRISCERLPIDSQEDEIKQCWQERKFGKFERSCKIVNIDPDHISADLRQGILTVTLGKKEATTSPKQIKIKTE